MPKRETVIAEKEVRARCQLDATRALRRLAGRLRKGFDALRAFPHEREALAPAFRDECTDATQSILRVADYYRNLLDPGGHPAIAPRCRP